MTLHENYSLASYNTFRINVTAEYFCELDDVDDLPVLAEKFWNPHLLGEGSNLLLIGDVSGCVIHNALRGIEVVAEDERTVSVSVASGEIWHEWVNHSLSKGWFGLENLSLIPGTVGAAPFQNIGAYGVEVKAVIESVNCFSFLSGRFVTLTNKQCMFGYRDSIFKKVLGNYVLITSVVFRLQKTFSPSLEYEALRKALNSVPQEGLTAGMVSQAVCAIRRSKLPDPAVVGNAGSFFKNPTVVLQQYESLKDRWAEVPSFPAAPGFVKVPAAWLIEKCGWKGYREQDFGVHPLQPLVLVNYGNATGLQLLELSERIIKSVEAKFNIVLEREVQVWP